MGDVAVISSQDSMDLLASNLLEFKCSVSEEFWGMWSNHTVSQLQDVVNNSDSSKG